MKTQIFLLICSLIFLASCQNKQPNMSPQKFNLSGQTHDMPDGTMLYFSDILTNQLIDSTSVEKNQFSITWNLTESPNQIFIYNKDYSETKSIWIENTPMFFDASASNFRNAQVTGSVTQDEFELFLQQRDTIESEEGMEKVAMDFIRQYPDSRVSASMLAGYSPNWEKEAVKDLYEAMSSENKASVYGLQIETFIKINRDHQIGDKMSDFEMENNAGELIRFSENLGQVTLLEFWASWCGPCREQNPELVKVYEKYKVAGFEILAVSLDFSEEDWKKAITEEQLTWNHVSDLKGRNSQAGIIYGVNAIPDNFLIDKDGIIIAKYVWGEELVQAIEHELHLNDINSFGYSQK